MAKKFLEIKGGTELAKALAEFPVKLEVTVMGTALRSGAKKVEALAKEYVPVRTGALKDTIMIRRRDNRRRGFVNVFVSAGDRKKGVFYAHMVEYGTQAHQIKPKNAKSLFIAGLLRTAVQHPGAKPTGFMRRALDDGAQDALNAIVTSASAGIRRLTKRRAKGLI